MAKYKVLITECLSRIVEVEVSDEEYAVKVVKDKYFSEEIVLDSDDFVDVDFNVVNNDTTI